MQGYGVARLRSAVPISAPLPALDLVWRVYGQ